MKKFNEFLLRIQKGIILVCGVLLFSLFCIGALMRIFLNIDFYGLEELVVIIGIWFYFAGSAYAGFEDTHINADMVPMFVKSPKALAIMRVIKYVITVAVLILVSYWCIQFAWWNFLENPKTTVFKFPMIIMQIPIPISFILLTGYMTSHLINAIKDVKRGGDTQ